MSKNYDLMPMVERKALLGALLQAYMRGGSQMVEGQQMTRLEIVAEMKALKISIEGTNAILAQIKLAEALDYPDRDAE